MKKYIIATLITCLLLPAVLVSGNSSKTTETWLMLGGDTKHTSVSTATLTPQIGWNTPTRWQFDLGIKKNESVTWSSPVSDGKYVYVAYGIYQMGSNTYRKYGVQKINIEDDSIYSRIDRNFSYNLSALGVSNYSIPTPAVHIEDEGISVVFVDSIGSVYMDGFRDNHYKGDGKPIISSPIIYDGKIYSGKNSGAVFSLEINDWDYQEFADEEMGKITTSPAIANDMLTFGDDRGNIFLFDTKNNKFLGRSNPIPGVTFYTPTIVERNNRTFAVYGSTYGHVVFVSMNRDNTCGKCNNKKISNSTFHSAPVAYGRFCYVGDEEGVLYKISLDRIRVVKKEKLDYPIWSQPVVCNGFLYVATKDLSSNNGSLYIFDLKDFSIESKHKIGGSTSSPLIIGDYLFIPSADGKIHRFEGQRPVLKVDTTKINYGKLEKGEKPPRKNIIITNDGGGLGKLSGEIIPDREWIACEPVSFTLGEGESVVVVVSVNTARVPLLGKNEGGISIYTEKYGTKVIEVKLEIVEPAGDIQVSTGNINFGDVIKGEKKSMSFTVSLVDSSKNSSVHFETSDDNFVLSRSYLELYSARKSGNVDITVDTSNLSTGTHKSEVEIWKGEKKGHTYLSIPVEVNVTERPAKPETGNDTKMMIIDDFMNGSPEKTNFVIYNDEKEGTRKPLEFDGRVAVEPDYDWFSYVARFTDGTRNEIELTCLVDVKKANFWPDENHKITLSLTVNEKPFTFNLTIKTIELYSCEIAFVIDSEVYMVNGRELEVIPPPFISSNGNTMVPIRFIADPLEYFFGASIEWIADIKTVLFTLGDTTLRLIIGYDQAILELPNGDIETKPMNSPAEIVNGRTFLPPRTIAEAFNAEVDWNSEERKATFTFKEP